jgi:hypothetical protein
MPRVGFELTITVFEREKTVYALDRAATVIGYVYVCYTLSVNHLFQPFGNHQV